MYYLELGTNYINVFYLTYKKQKIHISLHVASSPLRPLPTELSLSGYRVPLDWAKIEPVHKKLKLSKNFQLLSETIDNPDQVSYILQIPLKFWQMLGEGGIVSDHSHRD